MAAQLNLTIEQGATFEHRLIWKDSNQQEIDLTPYNARMHIRQKVDSPDPPVLELTDGNGITLGGVAGTIDIKIEAVDTEQLTIKKGVYDLEMVIPGAPEHVTRLVQGNVTISKEVTRT